MESNKNLMIFSEPFKHIVEDNFLDKEDFGKLKSRINNLINNSKNEYGFSVEYNQARIAVPDLKVTMGSSILSNKELIDFYKKYEDKLLDHLKKLAPRKFHLYNSFSFQLSKTVKKGTYHIHDDSAEKLLSVVIYLSPKKNIGTFLYKKKESIPSKQVDWRENRYLAFSRLEGKTRHSYKSNNEDERYTLVLNLLTSNRNLARWIEPGIDGKFFVIKFLLKEFLKGIIVFLKKLPSILKNII